MSITRLKQCLCSLSARVTAIENSGGGGGEGGATRITGPDVSTYNDARGVVGDWSYNSAFGTPAVPTRWEKVSVAPDTWISWPVSTT